MRNVCVCVCVCVCVSADDVELQVKSAGVSVISPGLKEFSRTAQYMGSEGRKCRAQSDPGAEPRFWGIFCVGHVRANFANVVIINLMK